MQKAIIIDKNRGIQTYLADIIARYGYEVAVMDVADAIRVLRAGLHRATSDGGPQVRLVIVDMGEIDVEMKSLEFLRDADPRVSVIMAGHYFGPNDPSIQSALKLGVSVLNKEELTSALHNMLSTMSRGREKGSSPSKIMVVEDDKDYRMLLSDLLSQEGFVVIEAENGIEAGAILLSRRDISLVLADLQKSRCDGLEFMRWLSKERVIKKELIDIPVIVMSCDYGGESSEQAFQELGAVATLTKPVDLDELLGLVHELAS